MLLNGFEEVDSVTTPKCKSRDNPKKPGQRINTAELGSKGWHVSQEACYRGTDDELVRFLRRFCCWQPNPEIIG